MKLSIYRLNDNGQSTIGVLLIDGKFQGFTIEDEFRTIKIKGETRIPSGTYKVILRKEGGKHERRKIRA